MSAPAGEPPPRSFEDRVTRTFGALKDAPFGTPLAVPDAAGAGVALLPFTRDQLANLDLMALLAAWRQAAIAGFTRVFTVTVDGTLAWSRNQLIERPDRISFLLREPGGRLVGHVGLSSFDFSAGTCEIDNIVRGEPSAARGVMQEAVAGLLKWTYRALAPGEIRLRTLNGNVRALALYHRLGFEPFALHPLARIDGADFVEWVPAGPGDHIDRFMVAMRHRRG